MTNKKLIYYSIQGKKCRGGGYNNIKYRDAQYLNFDMQPNDAKF